MFTSLNDKALHLRSLHHDGVLVLPNAWDAGSAVLFREAGARAVGTTSGGVSWAHGSPDGQHLTRTRMTAAASAIAEAVPGLPVTVDVEGGYGPDPRDVAATVEEAVAAGAAGINLEDSTAPGGPLFTVAEQAARLRAAREAAVSRGVPDLVINARTDVVLFGVGDPDGRPAALRARAAAYEEAGADCLFVPGMTGLDDLKSLTADVALPVNVMAGPGAPDVAALRDAGVRRVSVGTALTQVAYTAALRAARELLDSGTYASCEGTLDYGTLNGWFDRAG